MRGTGAIEGEGVSRAKASMITIPSTQPASSKVHLVVFTTGLLLFWMFKLNSEFVAARFSDWNPIFMQLTAQGMTLILAVAAWFTLERLYGGMPRLGVFSGIALKIGLICVMVIPFLGGALSSTLGEGQEASIIHERKLIAGGFVLPLALTTVILAPLMEELIFRGFLLRAPLFERSTISALLAVGVSTFLFTIGHVNYSNIATLSTVFMFGLVFAVARIVSDGLLLPILLHMVVNALVLFDQVKSVWLN